MESVVVDRMDVVDGRFGWLRLQTTPSRRSWYQASLYARLWISDHRKARTWLMSFTWFSSSLKVFNMSDPLMLQFRNRTTSNTLLRKKTSALERILVIVRD